MNRVRNLRVVLLSVLVTTGLLVAPGVSTPAAAAPPFCAFVTANRTDGTLRCTGQVMKFVGVNVRDLVFLDDVMAKERARLANPPRTSPNATDVRDGQRDLYHQLEAAAGMKADVMRVFLARDDYGPTNFPGTTSVTVGGVAAQVPNGVIAMGNKLAALFAFADVGHPALNDSGSNRYDNPPALGMKFQVSFTDSLIGPRAVNYVLAQDRPCQRGWITRPLTCTTLRLAAQSTKLLAQAGQLAAARMTLDLYLTTLDLDRAAITEQGYQVLRADALAVRATL